MQNLSPTLNKLTLHNSKESILTPQMAPSHHVGKFLPKTKGFFSHDYHPDNFSRGRECHRACYWQEIYPNYATSR